MNRFSRIRHHVDMKDVKKRHLEETAAEKIKQKQIEEEKRLQKEIYDAWKSDWRKDMIGEGMTTTDMFQFLLFLTACFIMCSTRSFDEGGW